ncbi:Tetratricopeptide TPR_2 repeat-containing protein [Actinobacteria bacterium OK074]|nr:Tetratricopeptide TPR_2 repeat-containing protein [Actinobacteria bacterium OK074]
MELEELAARGSLVLVAGMRSEAWQEGRDGFMEWFRDHGRVEYAAELGGSLNELTRGIHSLALPRLWLTRVHEVLNGSRNPKYAASELAELIERFAPDQSTAEPKASAAPADHVSNSATAHGGTVIQAGTITTLNIPQPPPPAPLHGTLHDPDSWPVAENIDPWAHGARPTRRRPGLEPLPPYVARETDGELNSALVRAGSEGGLVVVRGEPYAGKTRTALAVAAEVLTGFRVFAPAPKEDLRALPTMLRNRQDRCALWLDDLDGHLGDGGLESRLLAQLTELKVIVLATMREAAYDEYWDQPRGRRVLELAQIVDLPREWTGAERERAAAADDPRLTDAARRSGPEGIAAYLTVGPMLWEEWQRARRADRHPRGYALVRAAVDLARCGLRGPLAQDLLVAVHERCAPVAGMQRESVADALAWAEREREGLLPLLRRRSAKGMWEVSPYLVDTAEQEEGFPPPEIWMRGYALGVARSNTAYDVETVAARTRAAFTPAAEAGDGGAMHALGVLAESLGEAVEAEAWFRRATEAGWAEAPGRLGRILAERGEGKEAEPFLETAAAAGDPGAAALLGKLLRERAVRWLEAGAAGGDGEAAHTLGDVLLGSGRGQESLHWYTKAAEAGRGEVATSLGRLMRMRNNLSDAELWFRHGVALGDPQAIYALGLLLHRMGNREEEAEQYFRQAVAAGADTKAAVTLGTILSKRAATLEEGLALLRDAGRKGDTEAAYRLGVLLETLGQADEADMWSAEAAERGYYYLVKPRLIERLTGTTPADQPPTGHPTPPDTVGE